MNLNKFLKILAVLGVLALIVLANLEGNTFPAEAEAEGPPAFLRLHVLSNSDSEYDQEIKLAVRDLILVELSSEVRDSPDFNTVLEKVKTSLPRVDKRIKDYLATKNCGYTCQAKVGIEKMPPVTYSFMMLPEGDYWALQVTLGTGTGRNWWCVLYPPLCFLDLNDPEAVTVFAEEQPNKPRAQEGMWERWREVVERETRKIWLTQ